MSTIGCPEWDLETVCQRANEYGFDGIDFRGLEDELDITQTTEFTDRLDETKRLLSESDLEVTGISSSITVCEEDAKAKNRRAAERLIETASDLDVEYVRVFGGGDLANRSRSALVETAAETVDEILRIDGARDVQWLIETHDNWTSGEDCLKLVDRISDPNVGVLWDVGHTTRVGGESPRETYDLIGDDLEYLHVKDAVYDADHPDAMDDGWRYVPPGEGELPLAEALKMLQAEGYDGWVMFEHEKRWHPELPGPETAYPEYMEWFESLDLQ
ncbi:sugar phosphate isomerase/epimerase family protein [Halomicrobium urmianum]|uniref:sugar phosphate isomerase/epimerase family protein n=1 Tax=Halomicrobium urmianum TaxID=1586233 RepID=UPI001CDA0731|nr:sugar phosphate isomerase/epimerase [Halomicrobium urmianum]